MAKVKAKKQTALPNKSDRSYFLPDLSYIPVSLKERRMWAAQYLYFLKRNSQPLVLPSKAADYRALNRGIIDEATYRQIQDPKSQEGTGGSAQWMSSNFKDNPIDQHIRNILSARMEKVPIGLNCRVVDPMAKMLEQKEKEKIIFQRKVREIINLFIKEIGGGMQPVRGNEDPYKWIERFTQKDLKKVIDTIGSPIDQIKSKIESDDHLRLFMKFVYKNGIEIALEQAIKYYLLDQNKWDVNGEAFLTDIENFNTFSGEMFTDLTTGRKILKYLDPATVFTTPFAKLNGDDIQGWFTEQAVTFQEFEQMIGVELEYEDKKNILNYFKSYATNQSTPWNDDQLSNPSYARLIGGTKILLGRCQVLTQEAQKFSERYMNDGDTAQPPSMDASWEDTKQNRTVNVNGKVYNVWYSFYYIPMNQSQNGGYNANTQVEFDWQANHIYRIEKNVDMYRYGVDERYAKSDLVVWQDRKRMSFTDVVQMYKPLINAEWHQFQNCIIKDSSAQIYDFDLISGLLAAVDEGNKEGQQVNKNAIADKWREMKQTGQSFMKFRDKNGNRLDISPADLFVFVDNKLLEKAEKHLLMIWSQYEMMTRALSFPPAMEGVQPKARTPLGGVQMAVDGGSNNQWYIEKSYINCLVQCSERIIQWVKCVCSEKEDFHYEQRWQELVDVVGFASGATLEGIAAIPMANIGLTVENNDPTNLKELVNGLATQMVSRSQITPAQLQLILDTSNWKLALFELSIEMDKEYEKVQAQEERKHQMIMEQKNADLQVALALQGAKAQGVNSNLQTQGAIDSQLAQQTGQFKYVTKEAEDERRNKMKGEQEILKGAVKNDQKTHEENLKQQAAY